MPLAPASRDFAGQKQEVLKNTGFLGKILVIPNHFYTMLNPSQKSPGFSPRDECILFSAREGASAFRPRGSTRRPFLFFTFLLSTICCLLFSSGCATSPHRQALPGYVIRGVNYLPLIPLCEASGINLDYDTFTRSMVLRSELHKISLMVGETLVLVDGIALHLKEPVDIHQGTLVVPYRFKEQVLDKFLLKPQRALQLPLVSRIRRIIIDAGHGGEDPGAIGRSGIREKNINLDMAKRLEKLLRSRGMEVVMTRSTDKTVSLHSRVNIANNAQADLFVSIHSNANRVYNLNGFEIYYIASYVSDSKRALLSAQEAVLDLDDSFFSGQPQDLKAILWDMIYTDNRRESLELASAICQTVKKSTDVRILGIKGANFQVLRGVRIPGILIEIGFLSNRQEERLLKNNYYRQQMAESIAQGIQSYIQEYNRIMEACSRDEFHRRI